MIFFFINDLGLRFNMFYIFKMVNSEVKDSRKPKEGDSVSSRNR